MTNDSTSGTPDSENVQPLSRGQALVLYHEAFLLEHSAAREARRQGMEQSLIAAILDPWHPTMSARILNALARHSSIRTVEQLNEAPDEELRWVKSIGPDSIAFLRSRCPATLRTEVSNDSVGWRLGIREEDVDMLRSLAMARPQWASRLAFLVGRLNVLLRTTNISDAMLEEFRDRR